MTLELISRGSYEIDGNVIDFASQQTEAEAGTRLYRPGSLTQTADAASDAAPTIAVIDATTQRVAQRMSQSADGSVALLNFASARNPGGGFLNGAKAQEEDLCRCSGLYPCLTRQMEYYEANRKQTSLLYTDHAIFSPDVSFFKTRGTGELLANPFCVSVITAPAPNTGPFLSQNPGCEEELRQTFLRRWQMVLRIAADQGIGRLLLGAWGCGAFGGDPVMSSQTAREAIGTDGGGLTEVIFAIPGKGRQSRANLEAFQDTFGMGT